MLRILQPCFHQSLTNFPPEELYKAARLGNGDIKINRHMEVEDDVHEDDYAGPELPPDFHQEDDLDDQDGRFFGSGITRDTAGVLDFIDQRDKEESAVMDCWSSSADLVSLIVISRRKSIPRGCVALHSILKREYLKMLNLGQNLRMIRRSTLYHLPFAK